MIHYEIRAVILTLLYKRFYDNFNPYTVEELVNEPCFVNENKEYVRKGLLILKEKNFVIEDARMETLGSNALEADNTAVGIRITVKGIDKIIEIVKSDSVTKAVILGLRDIRLIETVNEIDRERSGYEF